MSDLRIWRGRGAIKCKEHKLAATPELAQVERMFKEAK